MEIRKEVKTYKVYYKCDECRSGTMEPTGICYSVAPPKFPHVCNLCGHKENFRCTYPRIVTE